MSICACCISISCVVGGVVVLFTSLMSGSLSSNKPKLPLLLSRMKEVAKVFLATNSDYKYTEARVKAGSLTVIAV